MSDVYAPQEIAGFLVNEKAAIHGVSPEVYAQNQALLQTLGEAARNSSDSLLCLQIIGSRSNGSSGLDSDLDLAPVAFATDEADEDRRRLANVARQMNISTDAGLAASSIGIAIDVPTDAEEFIYWLDQDSENAASLFESGVYSNQKLTKPLQLATLSILRTYPSQNAILNEWESLRRHHADSYLGDVERIHEKLNERLGRQHAPEIHRRISHNLICQRREKYGLPSDIASYCDELKGWVDKNKTALRGSRGYTLYEDVLQEL